MPEFLHTHGFGPHHSVSHAAVEAGAWERCDECATDCPYMSAPASVTNHERKHHKHEQ